LPRWAHQRHGRRELESRQAETVPPGGPKTRCGHASHPKPSPPPAALAVRVLCSPSSSLLRVIRASIACAQRGNSLRIASRQPRALSVPTLPRLARRARRGPCWRHGWDGISPPLHVIIAGPLLLSHRSSAFPHSQHSPVTSRRSSPSSLGPPAGSSFVCAVGGAGCWCRWNARPFRLFP
jgi:hypothetical protein